MTNCGNTIKSTCTGSITHATCVKYETELPEFSEISGCPVIEETTEELYKFVGELKSQTDLSELGEECLTYVLDSGKIVVKNVLLKLEEEVCTLKQKVTDLQNTAICTTSIVGCNFNFGALVDSCNNPPQDLGTLIQIMINKLNE